jgi:hypothetical protein
MVTKSTEFNYKDCEKIDGRMVNAYIDAHLNEENPVELDIESTWGDSAVDLTKVVKAAETVTRMELGSNAIEYFAEDGHVDCIYGDDLSRIISMHLLKDVDITVPPEDGDVYIYDGNKNKFVTFNLNSFVTDVNQRITNLNTRVNNLAGAVNTLTNKINDIESIIPFWPADKTTKLARGDINLISDPSNTNNKAHGLFTHDKNTDKYADEYFS